MCVEKDGVVEKHFQKWCVLAEASLSKYERRREREGEKETALGA